MAGFGDYTTALKTRDIFTNLITSVIDQERPRYRYATVISVDPDTRKATVRFPGGAADGSNDVSVKILSIVPSVGQTARIDGYSGDKFIADVLGAAALTPVSADDLPLPTDAELTTVGEDVTLTWHNDSGVSVSNYEVQFAEDAAFTVNPQDFQTPSTLFTIPSSAGKTIFAQVRSLNGTGGFSAWVTPTPASVTVEGFTNSPSDGNVPGMAPEPAITNGLGYFSLIWQLLDNADPVTYEVHISTVDGFVPDTSPASATYLGETTGNVFFVDAMPDDTQLVYGTNYFVRLVARDADGYGPAGPQAIGQPQQVQLGDVGNVPSSAISDGVAPASSPAGPTIKNGIGFLSLKWDHIDNPDAVTYEVHISNVSGFIPDANSYVMETPADFAMVRTQGAGAAYAALVYGTTYYVKLWAKDQDGYAPNAGTQSSGNTVQANTPDIAVNAITAASGIIADAAIATAKIQDAAITTAKIADLQVNTAKIADLAVSDAKITSLNVAKLVAGTLTSDITISARIKTADSGQRVELNSSGLKCYNSSGSLTVDISAGSATILSGTIQGTTITTSTSGKGVRMNASTNAFEVLNNLGVTGSITYDTTTAYDNIYINSGACVIKLVGGGGGGIFMNPNPGFINFQGQIATDVTPAVSGSFNLGSAGLRWVGWFTSIGVTSTATLSGGLTVSAGAVNLQGSTANINPSGLLTLSGGTGCSLLNVGTTTGTALVRNSSNLVGLASSATKYKTRIKKLKYDETVLDIKPITFKYKNDVEMFGKDSAHTNFGVLAEEVNEILPELVFKDAAGECESVFYERIGVLLVPIVRNHRDRLSDIESRLTKLEKAA